MPLLAKSSCGIRFGGVAQWLVQRLHKALVGGSNPPSATIYFYGATSVPMRTMDCDFIRLGLTPRWLPNGELG